MRIDREGRFKKFVEQVQHITFSGRYAARSGRRILYITERCVFVLCADGLQLIEIAPGVDLEKDILAHMDFKPQMNRPPRLMDKRIFRTEPMELKADLLSISLEDRIFYNPDKNMLFVNLAGYAVKTLEDVASIRVIIETLLQPLGKKVAAIGNYDESFIDPDLIEAYSEMQSYLTGKYFARVSRYTTSAFLRMKLGAALEKRGLPPHIYESAAEAHAFLMQE